MKTPMNISKKSNQRGVVLLEALVAVLLFSMGVLALVGLQAAMVKNTADSQLRSEASYIAQQWIGQMWADPANLNTYLIADNTFAGYDISNLLPSGTRTVAISGTEVTVTINWRQPGKDQHIYTITANIAGG